MSFKTCYLLLVLLTLANLTMIPHITKKVPIHSRVYKVQTTDTLQMKWKHIIQDRSKALIHLHSQFKLLPIPQILIDLVGWWAKNLFIYQDMVQEIEVVAQLSGLPFADLMMLNFIPQLMATKMCTGALVRTLDGKIIHGRNFDIEFMRLLSALLVTIQHYEKDKLLYTMEYLVGSAFTVTGIRHGAFAISQNARQGPLIDILTNLFLYDSIPTSLLIKKTIQEQKSFATAIHRLNYTKITSTGYYIVSGVKGNEGAVIERDQQGAHGYYTLTEEKWYLIQTNYDRDQIDPAKDYRRTPCQQRINSISKNRFTKNEMYQSIMLEWPTFNIGTILTAIMIPADHYYNATLWYGSLIEYERLEQGLQVTDEFSDHIQFLEN